MQVAVEKRKQGLVGFYASDELRALIEQAAAAEHRPVSNFVRSVMCEYFQATRVASSEQSERAA